MNDKNIIPSEPKTITIDLWKAVVIVVTAMLASAGAGLYGAMANINSDHFAVVAITKDIAEIKTNFMPVDLSTEKWKNNDETHRQIMTKLDNLTVAVNGLYTRIK